MTRTSALLAVLLSVATAHAAIPTISRQAIIDIAKSGVGCPYVWGGTCWDPNNTSWKGADCSGYATVCWQIPGASQTTDCLPHYYTASAFKSQTTSWTNISRDDLLEGDLLTSGSHVVIYDSGDKWGAAQVYEARGSAYGIVYRTKTVDSSFVARRRDNLAATSPPTPPAPPPGNPGSPGLTITGAIATIPGQAPDFCTNGASSDVFDWFTGQTTEARIDVANTGSAPASAVRLGVLVGQPYVNVTQWAIFSRPQAGSFALSGVDGAQSVPRSNPGAAFSLELQTIQPGEAFRITLQVRAATQSLDTGNHPGVRAWISNVDGYYSKPGYFDPPQNVEGLQTFNGGELRTEVATDVLETERCDGKDNDCDGQIDEGCSGATPDSGPGAGPKTSPGADAGVGAGPDPAPGPGGAAPGPGAGLGPVLSTGPLTGGCAVAGRGGPIPLPLLLLLALFAVPARRRR